jgi:hypothetical protein
MKFTNKAHLTPLFCDTSAVLRNPLNIVYLPFLILFLVVLSLFDFKLGIVALPIIILELVAVLNAHRLAKLQNGYFGVGFYGLSALLCAVLSAVFPIITLLESYTDFKVVLPELFGVSFVDSTVPLSLFNMGFDGSLYILLALVLIFVAKFILACSLKAILRTNTKRLAAFLISTVLCAASVALFTVCAFDRLGITSLLVKSKALGDMPLYSGLAIPVLGVVTAALYLGFCIHTFIKMRKNSYAF